MTMDVFNLFFACNEKGKGEHCVYCWFGPKPGCDKKLYLEFKRQVRQMLCPFDVGARVYVLKHRNTPYNKTQLMRGFVYKTKNEGSGWKIYVRNENGEYIGAFSPTCLGKTIFRTRVEAENQMREDNKKKKEKDAELP